MKATVAALRNEGFHIETINVRHNHSLAEKYHIRSVPTYIYVVDGEEVRRSSGELSRSGLRSLWRQPLISF